MPRFDSEDLAEAMNALKEDMFIDLLDVFTTEKAHNETKTELPE